MNKISKKITMTAASLLLVASFAYPASAATVANANEQTETAKTDRINSKGYVLNKKTGELTFHDGKGNSTVTVLKGEALDKLIRSKTPKTRSFDVTYFNLDISEENNPEDGIDVGMPFMVDPDNKINLETFNLPNDIPGIDVYFENEVGDDTDMFIDVPEYSLVYLYAEYPTENYISRVSCFYEDLDDIKVRSFTD